jgi:hypothetical protein
MVKKIDVELAGFGQEMPEGSLATITITLTEDGKNLDKKVISLTPKSEKLSVD